MIKKKQDTDRNYITQLQMLERIKRHEKPRMPPIPATTREGAVGMTSVVGPTQLEGRLRVNAGVKETLQAEVKAAGLSWEIAIPH